jgi:hypothetical protein
MFCVVMWYCYCCQRRRDIIVYQGGGLRTVQMTNHGFAKKVWTQRCVDIAVLFDKLFVY